MDYKATIRQWVEEAWNRGNLQSADTLYASTYRLNDPAAPPLPEGPDAIKTMVSVMRRGLPDLHFTITHLVQEGNTVVWRFVGVGTHRGELMGVPATGQRAEVAGVVISRFEGNRWAEDHVCWDALGLLRQIGAVPAPA